ncbi:MAG TPA: hypothetical protein VEH09_12130 [Thermodesulfobacteriota bacterium]|nr:hypothetical protein [Thermodesulfobacteriota bacterium]
MNKRVLWLRISYWTGGLVDGFGALQMIFPNLFAMSYKLANFYPGLDCYYASGKGASLMFGWSCLLLWADRRPVERRGVLLITIFPVLLGLAISGLFAVQSHFIAISAMVPTWIAQGLLTILFGAGYLNARDLNPKWWPQRA